MTEEEIEVTDQEVRAYIEEHVRQYGLIKDWVWGPRPRIEFDDAKKKLIELKRSAGEKIEIPDPDIYCMGLGNSSDHTMQIFHTSDQQPKKVLTSSEFQWYVENPLGEID